MRIHYVLSDFDVLEVTKLDQLAQAREGCDRLVVALVTDSDLQETTGRSPLHPLADRLDLVAQLRGVDQVFPHACGTLPRFRDADEVRYFSTEKHFQTLLRVPSTFVRPRKASRSGFLTTLHRVTEPRAVRRLAVG